MREKIETVFSRGKTVFFDLDGTLIKFHHQFLFEQTALTISQIGHPEVEVAHLEQCFSEFDFFKFVSVGDRDAFVERFWHVFDWSGFPKPELLDDSVQTVKALKEKGYQLAIVTSRLVKEAELVKELEPTGLLPYVSAVVTRPNEATHWTDKTDMLRDAAKRIDASISKSIVVGDTPSDVESAKKVGAVGAIALLSGGITEARLLLSDPDLLLSDIGEVYRHWLRIVDGNNRN